MSSPIETQHDRIEKQIDLAAPVARVWQALTDSRQFGEWFRCRLDGPFVPGKTISGNILYPGYEHVRITLAVQTIQPKTLFAYTWHPYAIDPATDYSQEPQTLVEFHLTPTATGTALTVIESGFSTIPAHRRDVAFRSNSNGWAQQLKNIEAYVHPTT